MTDAVFANGGLAHNPETTKTKVGIFNKIYTSKKVRKGSSLIAGGAVVAAAGFTVGDIHRGSSDNHANQLRDPRIVAVSIWLHDHKLLADEANPNAVSVSSNGESETVELRLPATAADSASCVFPFPVVEKVSGGVREVTGLQATTSLNGIASPAATLVTRSQIETAIAGNCHPAATSGK